MFFRRVCKHPARVYKKNICGRAPAWAGGESRSVKNLWSRTLNCHETNIIAGMSDRISPCPIPLYPWKASLRDFPFFSVLLMLLYRWHVASARLGGKPTCNSICFVKFRHCSEDVFPAIAERLWKLFLKFCIQRLYKTIAGRGGNEIASDDVVCVLCCCCCC